MNETQELLEGMLRKVIAEKSEISLIAFRDEYLRSIRNVRSSNYVRSVEYTFKQLINSMGDVVLTKLNSRIVEAFIYSRFNKSKSTASLYYRNLKAAFSKAVDWNYLGSNPLSRIKMPKYQKSYPAYMNLQQLSEILKQVTSQDLRDIISIAFFTGLRLSEILSLKWSNVNLKDRTLIIGDRDFQTKGKKVRYLPICDAADEILRRRFPKVLQYKNHLVFSKKNNFPYTGDWISKCFKRAAREAQLDERIHFHSLRHSFASYLVKNGVPLYDIKELLGHSSISITEIYSHLDQDSLKQAVSKFNSAAVL